MKTQNFFTPEQFMNSFIPYAFRRSSTKPNVSLPNDIFVFDWKNFFAPHISSGLQYHSHYRSFKFVAAGDRVFFFYNILSLFPTWIGYNGYLV